MYNLPDRTQLSIFKTTFALTCSSMQVVFQRKVIKTYEKYVYLPMALMNYH